MNTPKFNKWAAKQLIKVAKGRKVIPRFDLGAAEILIPGYHNLTYYLNDLQDEYLRLYPEASA